MRFLHWHVLRIPQRVELKIQAVSLRQLQRIVFEHAKNLNVSPWEPEPECISPPPPFPLAG